MAKSKSEQPAELFFSMKIPGWIESYIMRQIEGGAETQVLMKAKFKAVNKPVISAGQLDGARVVGLQEDKEFLYAFIYRKEDGSVEVLKISRKGKA